MLCERFRVLEQRAVPSVRVDKQRRVRQVLGQPVRVAHRNHLVAKALHNERRMPYALQVGETLAREALPLAKRSDLCPGDVRSGRWVAVRLSMHESRDERLASGLARGRWREEDLLQDRIATVLRILEVLCEARLLEVHDVLTAAWSCTDEDHATNDRPMVMSDLLGDHAAEREPEDVALRNAERVDKGQGVRGHSSHSLGYLAAGASDSGVVEEDDLSFE